MEDSSGTIDPHAADNEPTPTTVVAGAPIATAAPNFEASEDGNQVKYGGRTYLPAEAVRAERERAQGYAKTLQTLEPLMPEFEQFLASRKQGSQATVDRATRQVESDYTPDELAGYAITRGYYDKDNKPDLSRAQADLDIMTAIADRRANRAVQPVAQGSLRDRALANTARALTNTFVDGEPVAEEKYIRAAFDALPDEFKAQEETANMLQVMAAGLQALDERRTGRSRGRREPMFREGSGGRIRETAGESLDALDRAAARARGKTPDQWAALGKQIAGGNIGGTVLEEV